MLGKIVIEAGSDHHGVLDKGSVRAVRLLTS